VSAGKYGLLFSDLEMMFSFSRRASKQQSMTLEQFEQALRRALPTGMVLPNPGRGTSTVLKYTESQVVYKRGQSSIYVKTKDLFDAYRRFAGEEVTTNDLKDYSPEVFDSRRNGHGCNSTFLIMALNRIGLASNVEGTGRRGEPFRTKFAKL
jgi:hypothetical protein